MVNNRSFVLLLLGCVLFSSPSHSQQPPTVFGPGTVSCGTWTGDHKTFENPSRVAEEGWLTGYISGYSMWGTNRTKDLFGHTDNQALVAWVSNYCQAHPLDEVARAADTLILELNARIGSPH